MRRAHAEGRAAVLVAALNALAMTGCWGGGVARPAQLDGGWRNADAAGGPPPTATVVASFGGAPLLGLWGSSSQDIWLVGGNTPNPENGLPPGSERIVHFYGSGWTDVPTPSSAALFAVWGVAANDVWSGGGGFTPGSGAILHYDGTAWTELAAVNDTVTAIWGSSASDVWFAGGLSIWHWDGSVVSLVSAPRPPDDYLSLWGFSASDVWASGASGTLVHWDGSAWNVLATSGLYIYGLWGARPDDLWGVGNGGYQLHWNGTTVETTHLEGYTGFNTIHGLGANDIWAIGDCCWQDGGAQPWGAHYDGAQWTYETLPTIGAATALATMPPGTYSALVSNTLVQWQ
jgi:hypothetical protein